MSDELLTEIRDLLRSIDAKLQAPVTVVNNGIVAPLSQDKQRALANGVAAVQRRRGLDV